MSRFTARGFEGEYVSIYPNNPNHRPRALDFVEFVALTPPDWVADYKARIAPELPAKEPTSTVLDLGRLATPGLIDDIAHIRQQLGPEGV